VSGAVSVIDPFGFSADELMPFAAEALNPEVAEEALTAALKSESREEQGRLTRIEVLRHKRGRRALIAYQFERRTVLGKVRAKGLDGKTFQLVRELGERGFGENAPDGISVPRALGYIKHWNMWLQAHVSGTPVETHLLSGNHSVLASRIAAAAAKLHATPLVIQRAHTFDDELKILRERLSAASAQQPQLAPRILAVLAACERSAQQLAAPLARLIHRDFYPAQILVEPSRVWLLDLDLCSMGDPALDIGNFVAHVEELSLRTFGDAARWKKFEADLIAEYLGRANETTREQIDAWTFLSLARHIWISTQFPERREFTERLLALCEARAVNY
jgi:hypothetical protein